MGPQANPQTTSTTQALVTQQSKVVTLPNVPGRWRMTFHDEFDGTRVDKTKWQTQWREFNKDDKIFYQPYRFGAVNLESNLTVDKGMLKIRVNKEGVSWDANVKYTTGVINTAEKFSQQYGYFEIRLKSLMPNARGTDTAFWMFPETSDWPPELDICEIPGSGKAQQVLLNQHYKNAEGKDASHDKLFTLPTGSFADGWHTFGLLWKPDVVVWYIDGVERHRSAQDIPRQKMILFCSTEIQGGWTGDPAAGEWAQTMQVDYIRAYQSGDEAKPR